MKTNQIRNTYEELSDSYNELIDHKPHNALYDRPNTLSLFPERLDGLMVLDAACGPGKYAEELIQKGARITGFDLSARMIAHARIRNPENASFFEHDLTAPLTMCENESYDFVLCALALEYVEDWTLTIQEFHRVLKPDGHLIISITHPFFDYGFFQSRNYFQKEAVQCTWTGFGRPIEMHSFRRSLMDCIEPLTSNGFHLDKLLEPRPLPEMQEVDPRHFEELNRFPSFLCLRATKRS